MVNVLRPRPIDSLRKRLAAVVADDASLRRAQTVLLQPLNVIASLGGEVEGVLRDDDAAAMGRLRRMISTAGPWALQLLDTLEGRTGGAVLSAGGTPETTSTTSPAHGHEVPADPTRPCYGGVIDLGALVLVALAAVRVGRRSGDASNFVRTIQALAVAAAPAESLARGIAEGLTDQQIAALLSLLATTDSVDARLPAVIPTLVDECERIRLQCINALLKEVGGQADSTWETTFSHVISGVTPVDGGVLEVQFRDLDERSGIRGEDIVEELKSQGGATAKFVFRGADGQPIEVRARSAAPTKLTARVVVPDTARAGVIGVATDASKEAHAEAMSSLREYWTKRNAGLCLRDQGVDDSLFVDHGADHVLLPPAAPDNQWGVRIVDHWLEQPGEGPLRAGTPTRVTAVLAGADDETVARVVVDGTPFEADVVASRATADLPGALVVNGAPVRIEVYRTRAGHPDDVRPFDLDVAPALDDDGTQTQRFVVVYPTFIEGDQIRQATPPPSVVRARRSVLATGTNIEVVDLPWVDDEELVFEGVPRAETDPLVQSVLERLADLAARTSGIERAVTVAVIPGEAKFFAMQPADATRAVAVTTLNGVPDLLAQPIPDARARADRLRIVGRIYRDDVVIDEPVRMDSDRPAGARAPHLTQVLAVAVDEGGRELRSERIAVHAASRTGKFSMLLPVGPSVAAVELRTRPELLAVELRAQPQAISADFRGLGDDVATFGGIPPRAFERPRPVHAGPLPVIDRPSGKPTVSVAGLEGDEVLWKYSHSHGVRARIEIEVGRGAGVWSRFSVTDSSRDAVSLAGMRTLSTAPPTEVRLVASDGWSTDVAGPFGLPTRPTPGSAVLIRRLGKGRYRVEANHDTGPIAWRVDGEFREELDADRVFVAEHNDDGKSLEAKTVAGVADTVEIGLRRT